MTVFFYDNTLEGILTAVFDAYSEKIYPDSLLVTGDVKPMFCDATYTVVTDASKADRVWKGLEKKLSHMAMNGITAVWLSELPEVPSLLFRYIYKVFQSKVSIEMNFGDDDVLLVSQICKKVYQERLRVMQFARFQKTADGIYFAAFDLLYNVLPLAVAHFQDRFADQPWILYDMRRAYGYYYDKEKVEQITFDEKEKHILFRGNLSEEQMAQDEAVFQNLWRVYFNAIAIKERFNPRKQRQDMPVRFWKYLTEKNGKGPMPEDVSAK
jgi:probable DNA metabolism protein